MFQGATSFNGDISKWEVSSVSNMKDMFRDAGSFKHHLCGTGWVNSKATKAGMFVGSAGSISKQVCASNLQASREVCTRTPPASGIHMPKADSTKEEPFNPRFKPSDANLKREVAEYLKRYPEGDCSECPEGAIGEWDVSDITDMSDLFSGANMFNGDISKWDVSSVTKMNRMFMGASSFNGDISRWDVSRVRDMNNMFTDAKAFKGDISTWDVSNVRYMTDMFSRATAFNSFDCLKEHETPR